MASRRPCSRETSHRLGRVGRADAMAVATRKVHHSRTHRSSNVRCCHHPMDDFEIEQNNRSPLQEKPHCLKKIQPLIYFLLQAEAEPHSVPPPGHGGYGARSPLGSFPFSLPPATFIFLLLSPFSGGHPFLSLDVAPFRSKTFGETEKLAALQGYRRVHGEVIEVEILTSTRFAHAPSFSRRCA